MPGPLDGIRILDLTQVISGPWATMLLADQGADVLKVEPIGRGEVLRRTPGWMRDGSINALMANNNRGKRGIAVDLSREEGINVVRRIAASCDVFVQNFRPGVCERLGLGADDLRAETPTLITCSISGFGPDGPWADCPVYDPIIQAMTGHVAVQENPDIPFPDLVRTVVVDKSTALMAAQAITAALFVRERSGVGQHIDLAMLDAGLSFFWPDGMMAETMLSDGPAGATLYETYRLTRCSDGFLVYWVATEKNIFDLARALGHPEWVDDPRWSTGEARGREGNFAALGQAFADALELMTVAEATAALRTHDVAVGPVLSREEVIQHEQVVHNQSVVEWDHPTAGRIRQARPAAHFSDTEVEPRLSAPMLGEHTDAVLAEVGFDAETREKLREAGVVA